VRKGAHTLTKKGKKAMKTWFLLMVGMLCCILAVSPASAAQRVVDPLGGEVESAVPMVKPCPEENIPGMVCSVDAEGKVIAKGKILSQSEHNSVLGLVSAMTAEMKKRDEQYAKLERQLRQREGEITQLRQEAAARSEAQHKDLMAIEERKLTAQDASIKAIEAQTLAIEKQGKRLEEQTEAIQNNTRAQKQIAFAVQVVIPFTLVGGFLLMSLVIWCGFARLAKAVSVTNDSFAQLEKFLGDTYERLNKRFKEMTNTWDAFFKAQAEKEGLNYKSVVLPGSFSGNGNGHHRHKTSDTIPPGALKAADVQRAVEKEKTPPSPPAASSGADGGETQMISAVPTLSEAPVPEAEKSEPAEPKVADEPVAEGVHARNDTNEADMPSLDRTLANRKPFGGAAAQFVEEQADAMPAFDNNVSSTAKTVSEKPGLFSWLGRKPQPATN